MVKPPSKEKIEGNPTAKLGYLLLILFFSLSIVFTSCSKNNNSEMESKSQANTALILNELAIDAKRTEIRGDIQIRSEINSEALLATDSKCKEIFSYNIKDKTLSKIGKTKGKDNFIKTIVSNGEWMVWIENEVLIMDTSNKPFKWIMVAENILTRKQITIDTSSFASNKFNVPMFINFTPDKLSISDQNLVVYCKSGYEKDKVTSEVVLFDINNGRRKILDKSSDVTLELIADCTINNNVVVWSRFKELNDNYNFRLTQYKYSDLYLYDVKTGQKEQLTSKDFYHEPNMDDGKLVATKIPLKKQNVNACNSEIVLMNLGYKKSITTIVDENSPCYNQNDDLRKELYRCSPKISNGYVKWSNSSFSNTYLYDYKKDQFINIYDDNTSSNSALVSDLFTSNVLLSLNFDNGTRQYLFIDLNSK